MKKWIVAGLAVAILIVVMLSVNIENVSITGEEWYTAQELEEKIFPDRLSRNSIYTFITVNLLNRKKEIPFVEDYKITFTSPDSVDVIVYEKSITGYVKYMGSYMYFDKDGIVVDSSSEALSGIPEITGLDFGSIVLYRKLPVKDEKVFDDILNLTQILTLHDIQADRIDYSGIREATLYIGDLKVVLGTGDNISEKIRELYDMRDVLPKEKGTLYLDSYDPNNTNPAYTFSKK